MTAAAAGTQGSKAGLMTEVLLGGSRENGI